MISVLVIAVSFLFVPYFAVFVIAIVVGVDYFFFKQLDLEYEYALTMNELDIAKIMSKERRKQLMTLDLKQASVIGPMEHPKVKAKVDNSVKIVDCSSRQKTDKVYSIITKHNGKAIQLLFEPSETMLQGIRKQFPSKTIIE